MKNLLFLSVISLLTFSSCSKDDNPVASIPVPVYDTLTYQGQTYKTVKIGSQTWFSENLNAGKFIGGSTHPMDNDTIEKHCYSNSTNNCLLYGGFYTWNEAMAYSTTPGAQGICPENWHIPTLAEYETLKSTVNNDGNALKSKSQGIGEGVGTNSSGFSALLSGYRSQYGSFFSLGYFSLMWTSTIYPPDETYNLHLFNSSNSIAFNYRYIEYSIPVRCLKNSD